MIRTLFIALFILSTCIGFSQSNSGIDTELVDFYINKSDSHEAYEILHPYYLQSIRGNSELEIDIALRYLGVLEHMEKNTEAIIYAQKLQIRTNLSPSDKFLIGITLARLHEKIGNKEFCLEKLLETKQLFSEHDLDSLRSRWFVRMSSYQRIFESKDSAVVFANQAVEFGQKFNNEKQLADAHFLLGALSEDDEKKVFFFNKALQSWKNIGALQSSGFMYVNLSRMCEDKDLQKAYLDSAYKVISRLDHSTAKSTVYRHLSDYYRDIGDYKSALIFSDSLHQSSLEHLDKHNQSEIFSLEQEFIEKNLENELQIIKKQKDETIRERDLLILFSTIFLLCSLFITWLWVNQKNTKQKLEEALIEKEVLLKEIHHRVKNNMQIISGLLELQAHEADDENISRLMNEGKSRIEAMALIHQMLYSNSNLSTINFNEYIEKLSRQITSAYTKGGNVSLEYNMLEVDFDLDKSLTLGLIAHEVLNNSMKYAFGQAGGNIFISLKSPRENVYSFVIHDNGKGLSKDFDLEKSEALGLKLITMLSHEIRGDVQYSSDNGAKFKISWNNSN